MGFLGTVCGLVSSFCGAVGGVIGGLASSVAGALGIGVLAAGAFSSVVKGIANCFGIGNKKERPAEIGLKAEKSDKTFEEIGDFDKYKEYIDNIKLSDEDLKKLDDPDQNEAYSIVGSSVYMKGIDSKLGETVPASTYVKFSEMGVEGKDGKKILETLKEKKANLDINKAINCEIGLKERRETLSALREGILKTENPESISAKLNKILEEI